MIQPYYIILMLVLSMGHENSIRGICRLPPNSSASEKYFGNEQKTVEISQKNSAKGKCEGNLIKPGRSDSHLPQKESCAEEAEKHSGQCVKSTCRSRCLDTDQIRLLGIKQLSASIGIGSSHMQMMPPLPRVKEALSITLYFLIFRRSGAALFLISNG